MEARAPYHTPAPKGPRNLAPFIAAWLREQGFTVTKQDLPGLVLVEAHWLSSQGERFQFDYTWASAEPTQSNCRLCVLRAGQPEADTLFTPQHVRRLQEVRLLLLGNLRYDGARLLAKAQVLS